MSKTDFSGVF